MVYSIQLSVVIVWFLVRDSCAGSSVRLVSGKTPHEGIIEIRYNNTWATVLDFVKPSEPLMNAFVVCRMLNYTIATKGSTVWYNPHSSNSTYWPKSLRCKGREENIQYCYQGIKLQIDGSIKPPPFNAMYAVCGNRSKVDETLQVRLVNSNKRKNFGFVEQSSNQTGVRVWKRICVAWHIFSGYQWYIPDASVVCKMLGYKRAVGPYLYQVKLDHSRYSIVSKRYRCNGTEMTIAECAQGGHDTCSGDDYYAGALCEENASPPPVIFRLSIDKAPNVGFLEVQRQGVWGILCSRLKKKTGDFVCQQLGFLERDGDIYPEEEAPKTSISWEFNESCITSPKRNCSPDEMWVLYYDGPCEYPTSITCKVAEIPKYNVVSGFSPQLTIDRTGLSEKEKQLITYYQVKVIVNYYTHPNDSLFYIPGNTTVLNIGDGKTYIKGINKQLVIGKMYYVCLTAVYEGKNGNLGFGRTLIRAFWPSFEKTGFPTTPGPTTATGHSSKSGHPSNLSPTPKSLSVGKIVGTVIGVLLFITIIMAMIVCVYKKYRNNNRRSGEHMKLSTFPEDQTESMI